LEPFVDVVEHAGARLHGADVSIFSELTQPYLKPFLLMSLEMLSVFID